MDMAVSAAQTNAADLICARIERLPLSSWHTKVRLILGTCTFFDAYDAISISYILPVLAGLWHLDPGHIGLLLSSGFAGQFLGAAVCGWVAQRFGRVRTINWTIWLIAIFGIASGFAWSYGALLVLRFLQGLGIGGENPVAATYVNEIAKSGKRGNFVLFYQLVFPLGYLVAAASGAFIVPHFGWQWVFFIGALPALMIIPLRRTVPESPRWLARTGQLDEAERIMTRIEAAVSDKGRCPLPPIPEHVPHETTEQADWRSLFRAPYLGRTVTVWVMWLAAVVVGYGMLNWLPTLFRTIYQVPLQESLMFGTCAGVPALLFSATTMLIIDRVGRRPIFIVAFLMSSAALTTLWLLGSGASHTQVLVLALVGYVFTGPAQLSLWVYTPEIYPTRLRSVGTGLAASFGRISTMIAPLVVGAILQRANVSGVFLMFALLGLLGAVAVSFFAIEPAGRMLEDISP